MVKRAHMVSRGYLKAWADARGCVDVLDLEHARGFCTSIVNATVVSYAYGPEVLSHEVEDDYARVEAAGIPVIEKLRSGERTLTTVEKTAMIAFLDMHLDRGRYADQTKVRAPAVVLKKGGIVEQAELTLGDRLLLSQHLPELLRLKTVGLDHWQWRVVEQEGFATGDGAVLLWAPGGEVDLRTVTFPLSPSHLLVIGEDLPDGLNLNARLAAKSRRWIVGVPGTLNLNWTTHKRGSSTDTPAD